MRPKLSPPTGKWDERPAFFVSFRSPRGGATADGPAAAGLWRFLSLVQSLPVHPCDVSSDAALTGSVRDLLFAFWVLVHVSVLL